MISTTFVKFANVDKKKLINLKIFLKIKKKKTYIKI